MLIYHGASYKLTVEDDLIMILKELPDHPIAQIHFLGALPAQLQHAAILFRGLAERKVGGKEYITMSDFLAILRSDRHMQEEGRQTRQADLQCQRWCQIP